jgi:hypothetical protein
LVTVPVRSGAVLIRTGAPGVIVSDGQSLILDPLNTGGLLNSLDRYSLCVGRFAQTKFLALRYRSPLC